VVLIWSLPVPSRPAVQVGRCPPAMRAVGPPTAAKPPAAVAAARRAREQAQEASRRADWEGSWTSLPGEGDPAQSGGSLGQLSRPGRRCRSCRASAVRVVVLVWWVARRLREGRSRSATQTRGACSLMSIPSGAYSSVRSNGAGSCTERPATRGPAGSRRGRSFPMLRLAARNW